MRRLYQLLGCLFWIGLTSAAIVAFGGRETGVTTAAAQLFLPQRQTLVVESAPRGVPAHTPVLIRDADNRWSVAGWVVADRSATSPSLQIHWASLTDTAQYDFLLVQSSRRFDDTLKTLFPSETRQLIRQSLVDFQKRRGTQLLEELRPAFERAAVASVPVIEQGVRESLRRHDDEVQRLTDRYRDTLMKEQLVPIVREEVIPTVKRRAEPLMSEIGRELWDRASLWRFGWRALYDKSPLPHKDLTAQEWQRFVDDEVTPVLDEHADDFVEVQQQILTDLAANPEIRRALRETATTLIQDDELQHLLKTVIKEAVIENDELQTIWRDTWQSPDVQRQLEIASAELEPLIRQIGDQVFGDRENGINPRFARVLRNQILGKDRMWIEARRRLVPRPDEENARLEIVAEPSLYPLVVQANAGAAG